MKLSFPAGRMVLATALTCVSLISPVLAQEPEDEARRPPTEITIGTWISVGETKWAHNASSVPGLGNPTSKLDYKDVGTNVIDVAGKFWFSPKVFTKLNVGFANIGGGRLTDDDYGAGQQLFSSTQSNINGNNMWYVNADLGGRVTEFAHHRGYFDVFGGYQYWHTEYEAVGVAQISCNPAAIPGLTCLPPGTSTNQGQTVITNTTSWHSLRIGATSEYRITRRISIHGTAVFIPASYLDNKDQHHLRPDLQQNPSFAMTGYGIGADADVGLRFQFMKNFAAEVGYRVFWNQLISGNLTVYPVNDSSQSFPLTQFQSLRHGLTAGLTLLF
ncbi:conserved exported protein of unknown function [Nitrospira japonica]|uniref:Uncharacterized protein n=1 Tax=Nitrospira japonica TaxID=1325564 RepID=A0A1W1I8V2_9BACT|nr:hypothetical protein [Nitrospira japonica]SLM49223.1 conserved exported protein of unknown function [Nitrospira japonica]